MQTYPCQHVSKGNTSTFVSMSSTGFHSAQSYTKIYIFLNGRQTSHLSALFFENGIDPRVSECLKLWCHIRGMNTQEVALTLKSYDSFEVKTCNTVDVSESRVLWGLGLGNKIT